MLIWNGSYGGLADSKFSGIAGSFYKSVGIDGHSVPGLLQVQQKLTKESGSTITAFCKVSVAASNGYTFWFSSTDGKIWARNSSGTYSLAYTTAPAAGSAGCLGAFEFNGYIYWATQSRLHRIAIANADDSWSGESLNWATFDITDSEFHPMAIQDLTLFIGDGHQVAQVDENGVFNSNVLDISTPLRIKTMIDYDVDLLIGTFVANTVNKTQIIRWDTVSPSWNTLDTIPEAGINAFIRDDNYLYVNAGRAGNIYFYDGQYLVPFKKIPGTYSNSAYGLVHPGSVANLKGMPLFGFSNGSGNPADQGVYCLGSYSRDYPKVLDMPYPISEGVTSSIEIGAIIVADFDLLVAWKNGSTYGVDKIDYTAKYASAYLETMMLAQNKRDDAKTLDQVIAFYNSLPANTGVTFSYSINGAAYVAMTPVTNSIRAAIESKLSVGDVGSIQIKIAFTVSGNNAPTLEAIGVDIQ